MVDTLENKFGILVQLSSAARNFREQWRSNWRSHVIAGGAGLLLALAGAFGTQGAPLPHRMLFWTILLVAGSSCASVILIVTSRRPELGQNRLIDWAILASLITIPMSLFSWALSGALFGASAPFLFFVWVSAVISSAMTALMMLVNTPGFATEGAPDGDRTKIVRFMARLPPELKGAEIYAINAEDHYLRIHSSKGSTLILSRFSDAIAEIDGIEGAQVHRSWWVARDAIVKALRTRSRVQLELKSGVIAPVSRPNVKALQKSEWI